MTKTADIFECKQCGSCCMGETTVSLDDRDVFQMVECLHTNRAEVEAKYWRITGRTIQMKTVNGYCIFYDQGCTIHHGKPWRCRQWPLHPSILHDERSFQTIRDSCPGINRELSYEQFRAKLHSLLNDTTEF